MRHRLQYIVIELWAWTKETVQRLLLLVWGIVIGIAALVMLIDWVMGW